MQFPAYSKDEVGFLDCYEPPSSLATHVVPALRIKKGLHSSDLQGYQSSSQVSLSSVVRERLNKGQI